MTVDFQDELAGGTILVRPALQSPNYVAGSAGWAIKVDGSAEFNNVTIRGATVAGGQALYYNGAPAAGNLIVSISGAAGADTFGNAYVKGIGAYGAAGQIIAKDAAGDTATLAGTIPTSGTLAAMPGLAMQPVFNVGGDPATIGALDPGDHATFSLLLTSPSNVAGGIPGTDYSQINMVGPHVGPTEINMDAASVNFNSSATINSAGRLETYGGNTFTFFTPTVTGGGTATFTTLTGLWERVGKMIFVNIYIVVNAAGSGATAISVAAPTVVARSQRQVMHAHGGGLGGPGAGEYTALCFTTGAGAVIDRITRGGVDLTGANLSAGATIAIEGWYREG
jgi:hypothetical protein